MSSYQPEVDLFGIPVVQSPLATAPPSPGEHMRRTIRHGYATTRLKGMSCSILEWLGEDPGPLPDEHVPAVFIFGTDQPGGRRILMHPAELSKLRIAFHKVRYDARPADVVKGLTTP